MTRRYYEDTHVFLINFHDYQLWHYENTMKTVWRSEGDLKAIWRRSGWYEDVGCFEGFPNLSKAPRAKKLTRPRPPPKSWSTKPKPPWPEIIRNPFIWNEHVIQQISTESWGILGDSSWNSVASFLFVTSGPHWNLAFDDIESLRLDQLLRISEDFAPIKAVKICQSSGILYGEKSYAMLCCFWEPWLSCDYPVTIAPQGRSIFRENVRLPIQYFGR